MHILFICSGNKDRSPTAEELAVEINPAYTYESAGTNHKVCRQLGTTPCTQEEVARADLILVMEDKHRKFIRSIQNQCGSIAPIHVLGIPDNYKFGHPELKKILLIKMEKFLIPNTI